MNPIGTIDGATIIEVDYYPDLTWPFDHEPVKFVFARRNGSPEFCGAFYNSVTNEEIGYRVREPCPLDQLPSGALSEALAFALCVCHWIDEDPPTQRDPSKRGTP